jgi:RNA polymerase sigma factor (sigma-70 family)
MHAAGFPDDATLKDIARRLHVFFRVRLPQDIDPRDLVADVLLTLPEYRGEAHIMTYAFAVARNRLAEHRRRRVRRPIDPLPDEIATASTGGSTAFRRRQLAALVETEINEIESPYGEAVRLRLRGLEPREIAERLGVNSNTVRSRLVRGFARLRERVFAIWGPSIN